LAQAFIPKESESMKTVLFLVLVALFCCTVARPQSPAEKTAPRFQCELANLAAPDSSLCRLLAGVSVLQAELAFLPSIKGFEAQYRIALAITNARGDTIATREERARLQVETLAETHSRRKYAFHRFVFDLPAGECATRITLLDLVSNEQAHVVAVKRLRNFDATQTALAVSDAVWLERASGEEGDYVPMLFENTTNPNRALALYLEILSRDRQAPLHVRQTIRNARKEVVIEQQRAWPRRSAIEKLFLPIDTELLPYGTYEVEMLVQQAGLQQRAQASFRLAWDGFPATALHLNHALAAAKYLATEEESRTLQAAIAQESLTEKQNALQEFWQAHDTTGANGVYAVRSGFYQRLVEAEDKFGGERRGWQTDLGRIYLAHGAPDEIEFHTRAKAAQPFQVWRYRTLQKEFLFVDRKGLGLYHLAIGQD
jgi:GWxTD domain-containing protein